MKHFKKHWSADLQGKVRDVAEEVVSFFSIYGWSPITIINCIQFKQRHEKLSSDSAIPLRAKKGRPSVSNVKALLRELESSEDEDSSDDTGAGTSATPADPTKPWLREFNQYLNAIDELSDGQTIVQWWGVSTLPCE